MIALDTNVLLRALADDPAAPQQCAAARQLIAKAGRVRISSIVFVESLWVLARTYGASRREVAKIALTMLDHPLYQIGDSEQLREAVETFSGSNIDIADAVALVDAKRAECKLYTFDRKLAKLIGTANAGAA